MTALPPIVCISNAEWDAPLPTNRQQIMRRFAGRTRVAYIEAPLPVAGSFIGRSRRRTRHPGWRVEDGVHILQAWDWAPYPLTKRSKLVSRWMDQRFRAFVIRAWRELRWPRPVAWFYAPDGGDLLGAFDERLSVYHCVDDYEAIERYNGYRRVAAYTEQKTERYLASHVDALIVTTASLRERWRASNPRLFLAPNVADTASFARALEPGPDHPALASIPRPRAIFLGALDGYKVDFQLLGEVARLAPQIQFVMIGPVGSADMTSAGDLPRAPNIWYPGYLPHDELPAAMRNASAALIPYRLNDYTASVSPMKLYEYLAAGLPVVATPLPSLVGRTEMGALLADPDPARYTERLAEAIHYDQARRRLLSERASLHSWEGRMVEFESLILDLLSTSALPSGGRTLQNAHFADAE